MEGQQKINTSDRIVWYCNKNATAIDTNDPSVTFFDCGHCFSMEIASNICPVCATDLSGQYDEIKPYLVLTDDSLIVPKSYLADIAESFPNGSVINTGSSLYIIEQGKPELVPLHIGESDSHQTPLPIWDLQTMKKYGYCNILKQYPHYHTIELENNIFISRGMFVDSDGEPIGYDFNKEATYISDLQVVLDASYYSIRYPIADVKTANTLLLCGRNALAKINTDESLVMIKGHIFIIATFDDLAIRC